MVVVWRSGAALLLKDLDDLINGTMIFLYQKIQKFTVYLSTVCDMKHTSKSTSEWLKKQQTPPPPKNKKTKKNKVKVLGWPSQSLDLNPIARL